MNTTIKAAIYRRVSAEHQAGEDKTSLEVQEVLCAKAALERGWQVGQVYIKPGISGELFEERPALQKLLAEAA